MSQNQTQELQPRLKVVVKTFPESNGRRNWTAMFKREEPWGGLVGNCGGITIAHSEHWNRVAYVAERARYLLGLRSTEPHILHYGKDVPTPQNWDAKDPDAVFHLPPSKLLDDKRG